MDEQKHQEMHVVRVCCYGKCSSGYNSSKSGNRAQKTVLYQIMQKEEVQTDFHFYRRKGKMKSRKS